MSPRQHARRRLAHRSRLARRLAARLLTRALTQPERRDLAPTFDDGPDAYDRLIATASHLTGIPVSLIIGGSGDGSWSAGWARAIRGEQ